jgi:hypothetical protein
MRPAHAGDIIGSDWISSLRYGRPPPGPCFDSAKRSLILRGQVLRSRSKAFWGRGGDKLPWLY